MGSNSSAHLSDEDLARFEDGELSQSQASHLESCADCGRRLRDFQSAKAAYLEYRDSIRGPRLPAAPKAWLRLDALVARQEAPKAFRWWPIAAFAAAICLVVAVVVLNQPAEHPSIRAHELLTQSANVALPEGRFISVRLHGRALFRPAVFATDSPVENAPELAHLRKIFSDAHYSWKEPLSARSFLAWRDGLKVKRDTVSVIGQSYRVRTENPGGALHSAWLTLRVRDLRPLNGSLEFEQEGTVELAEAPAQEPTPAAGKEPPVETRAGPADTLHVLAALNEIGADVGEPIDVSEDPQHREVIVRSSGLSPKRRHQIAQALRSLPRVRLDLESGVAGPLPTQAVTPERYATGIPAPLRQQFEDRLGGAVGFEVTADHVLEASASVLARAHAVHTLAERFPAEIEVRLTLQDRELLHRLRASHVTELSRLAALIRMQLKPLIGASNSALPVTSLVSSAQEIDNSLTRLLAGSYSQSEGEEMLHGLASQIERLERAIQAERADER